MVTPVLRLLASRGRRPRLPGTRPPAAALRSGSAIALTAAAAGLLVLSVIVAAISPGRGVAVATARAPKARAPQAVAVPLYRVVGCRSQGVVAHRAGPHRREVAIGFDDGPWQQTPSFVKMLERSRATATFFMIGRQIGSQHRSMLLRELRDGDLLGDHTFSHPDLLVSREVRSQLSSGIGAIRAVSGYTPCLFRPPYGAYDGAVLRTARSLGLSTVMWNVDPADYTQPGTGAIEQRVLAQVQPGSIIISHDGGGPRGQTLAAYPGIIRKLRARGYRIVSMLELLGYRPVYEPCIKLCDGIGVPRSAVPRGAIVIPAP
jgi:peptidoglycan-N-acetylglucosamine deacetylase